MRFRDWFLRILAAWVTGYVVLPLVIWPVFGPIVWIAYAWSAKAFATGTFEVGDAPISSALTLGFVLFGVAPILLLPLAVTLERDRKA